MMLLWALWSVLVWPLCFAWMLMICLYSIPVALVWPFHKWQHLASAPMLGMIPRFTGSKFSVTYDERFDPDRRSVYVQNHIAMIDGHVALATINHPFAGIENAAHFLIPGYGWMMKLGGGISVAREPGGRLDDIIEQARDRVDRCNMSILVLPEGGRTHDGKLKPFHRGGLFMARELGLPIVPLAVRGLYQVLHRGSLLVRPGNIEVYVGPQIETAGLGDTEIEHLTRAVRQALAAWIDRKEPLLADLSQLIKPRPGRELEASAPAPELFIEVVEETQGRAFAAP